MIALSILVTVGPTYREKDFARFHEMHPVMIKIGRRGGGGQAGGRQGACRGQIRGQAAARRRPCVRSPSTHKISA